jgi:hypothetical protein
MAGGDDTDPLQGGVQKTTLVGAVNKDFQPTDPDDTTIDCPQPPAEVKGTPTPIGNINSIGCKGGKLVVQNNNKGPDRSCTQAHESSHIQDWKNCYGQDLCKGVPDGSLLLGGDGYAEFLRQSECTAYGIGKACREQLLKTAADKDKAAIQTAIDRDNAQIKKNKC